MDISPEIFAYMITALLALLSVIFGKKYSTAEKKLSETSSLAKELAEALKATSEAIEDKYISEDEAKQVVKEWKDVIRQGKKLLDSS